MNTADKFTEAKARVSATVGPAVAEAREKVALGVLQYGELRAEWMRFRIPVVVALVVVALVAFWAGTHFRG
jgi:hypothetical protein